MGRELVYVIAAVSQDPRCDQRRQRAIHQFLLALERLELPVRIAPHHLVAAPLIHLIHTSHECLLDVWCRPGPKQVAGCRLCATGYRGEVAGSTFLILYGARPTVLHNIVIYCFTMARHSLSPHVTREEDENGAQPVTSNWQPSTHFLARRPAPEDYRTSGATSIALSCRCASMCRGPPETMAFPCHPDRQTAPSAEDPYVVYNATGKILSVDRVNWPSQGDACHDLRVLGEAEHPKGAATQAALVP